MTHPLSPIKSRYRLFLMAVTLMVTCALPSMADPPTTAPAPAIQYDASTPQKCLESLCTAFHNQNIQAAVRLFQYEESTGQILVCKLAFNSANMRLRDATLKAFGAASTNAHLFARGHTYEETLTLLKTLNIQINDDTATFGDDGKMQRIDGAWKIIPSPDMLGFDLTNLSTAAAKNLTTRDLNAGKFKTIAEAKAAYYEYDRLMSTALGDIGRPYKFIGSRAPDISPTPPKMDLDNNPNK